MNKELEVWSTRRAEHQLALMWKEVIVNLQEAILSSLILFFRLIAQYMDKPHVAILLKAAVL